VKQWLSDSLKTIRLCNSFVHVPIVTKRRKDIQLEAKAPPIPASAPIACFPVSGVPCASVVAVSVAGSRRREKGRNEGEG
jgi:hypothetical protein